MIDVKRLGLPLTAVGLLVIFAAIFFVRPSHRQYIPTPAVPKHAVVAASFPNSNSRPAAVPALDLHLRTWRPDPVDAYRNSKRSGYAWILRQMGMSEADLDRLVSNDFAPLLKDLAKKADQGDQSAVLSLGWLARRCALLRNEEQLNSYQQIQSQDARLLPSADSAWFTGLLNQDIATDRNRIADCAVIDQEHVAKLLTDLSQQGNGASTFMLAEQANNQEDANLLGREAALQGFAEAQYEWALDLLNGRGFFHGQPGDPSAADFLRSAADQLATARAALALCEYHGCGDEAANPAMAIADARMAAQQGQPGAMLSLAANAPPSLISPTEAKAWALFDVALQQRGCQVGVIGVNWMKSMAARSANASPEAQALADKDWQLYGAGAMQNLGC
jgi:hypothetical protein